MDTWWRTEPLKAEEEGLLEALLRAHHQSVFRLNASSVAVLQTFDSSGDLSKAIAAALLTMGGKHAPLERTYAFLSLADATYVAGMLKRGEKVPGWGGTFQKDQPDPLWAEVGEILARIEPALSAKLDSITVELHRHGKQIYPNPSAYTAAAAIAVGLPGNLAAYLFVAGRLTAWTQIVANQLGKAG